MYGSAGSLLISLPLNLECKRLRLQLLAKQRTVEAHAVNKVPRPVSVIKRIQVAVSLRGYETGRQRGMRQRRCGAGQAYCCRQRGEAIDIPSTWRFRHLGKPSFLCLGSQSGPRQMGA